MTTSSKSVQSTVAVVLDLDGVILKSNFIKHRAMLSLFSEFEDLKETISEYILANGGVPRREKIAAIISTILENELGEEVLSGYSARYSIALEDELTRAPVVEGIPYFLAEDGHDFYVSSSAPEREMHEQLARRQLEGCFSIVYGSDTPKDIALRKISGSHAGNTVFFGDSIGDLEASQEADVAFIAVVNERDKFSRHDVVKVNDFTSLSFVESAISEALRRNAR